MGLRREAMMKGIQVQLSKLEDPRNPHDKIPCVAYRLPMSANNKDAGSWKLYTASMAHHEDTPGWGFSLGSRKPNEQQLGVLASLLALLPEDSLALESNRGALTFYWREKGESSDIDNIYKVLTELQTL